jgi:hypothetical protein
MWFKKFKFENDDFWWERLRFEDTGVNPEIARKYLNFVLPDKFFHFLTCYLLTLLFSIWVSPWISFAITFFLMVILWEVVWDGMLRHGFSWKDLISDLLGMGFAVLQLLNPSWMLGTYLISAGKGFLCVWLYSLIKDDYKKESFIILITFCFMSTGAFTKSIPILKHIVFLIGAGICYWWLQNPKIGQNYEENLEQDCKVDS